jgi:hypothetical protein
VLRSRDRAGAEQELWALLAVCQALRTAMTAAAESAGADPDRASFTIALQAARDQVTAARGVAGGAVAVHLDGLAELLIEAEADEHGHIPVHLQPRALAELSGVLGRQRVQPQAGGQLVNDLVGRVLDVQPEGLARLNELRYQRRGRLPDNLAAVINPAPHGSHSTRQGRQRKGDVGSRDIGRRYTGGAVTPRRPRSLRLAAR